MFIGRRVRSIQFAVVVAVVIDGTQLTYAAERTFTNPVGGESLRVLKECKDTDGEFSLMEVTGPPNIGVPDHKHFTFSEKLTVLEGTIYANIEGETMKYSQGETLVFDAMVVHRWWTEEESMKIRVETHPCVDGFHQSIEIMANMPPEKVNDKGIPTSLWEIAAISDIGEGQIEEGIVGRIFYSILRLMMMTNKGKRIKEELLKKYIGHDHGEINAMDTENTILAEEL